MAYQHLNEDQPAAGTSIDRTTTLEDRSSPDVVTKLTDVDLDGETGASAAQARWAEREEDEEDEEEELNEGDTVTLLRDNREEEGEIDRDEVSGTVKIGDSSIQITTSQAHKFKWVRYTLGVCAFVLLFAFLVAAITLIAVAPPCDGGNNRSDNLEWWKTTIIYQCYPRSFQDSDGDGNGDLRGILKRVDYFVDIGVKTVWLNPIFRSPQKDGGYDISDYTDIDPLYGTLDDLKALLKEFHSKGIKLLLDFVPNHTSNEHPWFVESRTSKNNAKRDWYIWADGTDERNPPNNWISVFGGSAWTYDNATRQYYFHQFSEFQPDLNYRNPEVMEAMEQVLRFWLDLGIDGFRFDAVAFLLEDPELNNEVRNPNYNGTDCTVDVNSVSCYDFLIHNLTTDYPGIHNLTRSWRKIFDLYEGDRFMVGEIYDPVDKVMSYYGQNGDEFHFPFNFGLLENSSWFINGIDINKTISAWLDNMPEGAWPNWVLGNHDNPRVANRVGYFRAAAMNVLLLTLPGTPTTYYGEEILMTDFYDIPDNKKHDTVGNRRDPERTPMQWDTSPYAGFTSVNAEPWLPIPSNSTTYNVQSENNKKSMLSLYKNLARIKSEFPALRYANYHSILSTKEVHAYHRYHKSSSSNFTVLVNFSPDKQVVNLDSVSDVVSPSAICLSSNQNRTGSVNLTAVELDAGEALVLGSCTLSTSCG